MTEEVKLGRPSLYRDEYADNLIEFFSVQAYREFPLLNDKGEVIGMKNVPNKFPTLARFATISGVSRDTLYEWSTATLDDGNLKHPDFSYAYKRAKEFQEAILVEGAMAGAFQANFSIFTAKNVLGWRDKIDQEITGADGASLLAGLQVSFVEAPQQKDE